MPPRQRLWQNSLRRIPLLTSSATNCCTSARVRRLDADDLFSTVIQPPHTYRSSRTGVLVRRLPWRSGLRFGCVLVIVPWLEEAGCFDDGGSGCECLAHPDDETLEIEGFVASQRSPGDFCPR